MKKLLLLSVFLLIGFYSYSQIPEDFIGTWYLEYFSSPQGEIFVNTLDVSQGPSFTVTESLQITGNSFCNDFSGEYIYVNTDPLTIPHTFQPINIIRGTIDCGSNEIYETQFYVPFVNEQVADIEVLQEDFLVLQYFNPTLYQVYRDEPVLSIDENELNKIQIYPNPVKDLLMIDNTSTTEITSIKMYDVLGRLVLEEKGYVNQIDVSHLNSGVLLVHIETDVDFVTMKIIKE
jgi:type IX secretion system substrate protein